MLRLPVFSFFFFFNDTATTEIYTFPYTTLFRSHALKIVINRGPVVLRVGSVSAGDEYINETTLGTGNQDRKSTRLNSSHSQISYAVFCLKKKKPNQHRHDSCCRVSLCYQHTQSL